MLNVCEDSPKGCTWVRSRKPDANIGWPRRVYTKILQNAKWFLPQNSLILVLGLFFSAVAIFCPLKIQSTGYWWDTIILDDNQSVLYRDWLRKQSAGDIGMSGRSRAKDLTAGWLKAKLCIEPVSKKDKSAAPGLLLRRGYLYQHGILQEDLLFFIPFPPMLNI